MRALILLIFVITPALAFEEETEALSAMRLGCEKHGVALGCFNYANMLVRNEKTDEADKYYKKGCKLKHEDSCQKQKWDIPDRVIATPTPAPASVDEEQAPDVSGFSLESEQDINQ